MSTFEQAFSDAERAASSVAKAAASLQAIAKQMQKAAQEGNITNLKRASERLNQATALARQEVSNAVGSWPFTPELEEKYLRESYEPELLALAREEQVQIHQRDGRLICFPSMVRINPSDNTVTIDRKKVGSIRPTRLVAALKQNQSKTPNFRSELFLERLYGVYQELVGGRRSDMLDSRSGTVIGLSRIYAMFTSRPGSNREYDQTDFARDLYFLDVSGVNKVRSGATVSFPASTGTRSQRGTFSFVSPEGEIVTYYGIQFTEAAG